MSVESVAIIILLGTAVLFCVIGVLAMWCMREPMQALHYLAMPATVSIALIAVAVFLQTGFGPTAIKTAVIVVVLLSINSVVAHATARAFYIRGRARGKRELPEWDFSREEQS